MSRNGYSIDLIKQMAECDANYIRLLKLVPHLHAYRDRSFDSLEELGERMYSAGATGAVVNVNEPEKQLEGLCREFYIGDVQGQNARVTVEIKIVEAFKYTSTLEITQRPVVLKRWMTNPSMLVRAYHDANTAEVLSYQGHRNLKPRYKQPNPKMYHADEKMQVNRFLGEWLSHCLNVGRSMKAPELTFSS